MSLHGKFISQDNLDSVVKPAKNLTIPGQKWKTIFLVKTDKGGTQVFDPGSNYMVVIIHQSVCLSVCKIHFN